METDEKIYKGVFELYKMLVGQIPTVMIIEGGLRKEDMTYLPTLQRDILAI